MYLLVIVNDLAPEIVDDWYVGLAFAISLDLACALSGTICFLPNMENHPIKLGPIPPRDRRGTRSSHRLLCMQQDQL